MTFFLPSFVLKYVTLITCELCEVESLKKESLGCVLRKNCEMNIYEAVAESFSVTFENDRISIYESLKLLFSV